ncbi:hypothetical protein QN277_005985 [Acacia crassicarpa]|uniref:Uncharacterized protein n=1 Tax=Acacia crassicarpa TaxID=499986 RepID=A0AAE1IXD6_9FABA|nr:hypothetical protein QN277_005985 [Acacia crassicarpa]
MGGSDLKYAPCNLKLVLHDTLDSSGIDTTQAREARKEFCLQIQKFCGIERETSININRCVHLGRTALCIGAEDDSLVSHSSVLLPVDAFIERLDDLSMDYCTHYSPSFDSSQGFRRTRSSQRESLVVVKVRSRRRGRRETKGEIRTML